MSMPRAWGCPKSEAAVTAVSSEPLLHGRSSWATQWGAAPGRSRRRALRRKGCPQARTGRVSVRWTRVGRFGGAGPSHSTQSQVQTDGSAARDELAGGGHPAGTTPADPGPKHSKRPAAAGEFTALARFTEIRSQRLHMWLLR